MTRTVVSGLWRNCSRIDGSGSAFVLQLRRMPMELEVLNSGSCERLKAGVHGAALGIVALMGLYNAAAWLRRRESHLAVNALLYSAPAAWEQHHFAHHLAQMRAARERAAMID